jgi:tetratricopeptide (TPR) repeat protein
MNRTLLILIALLGLPARLCAQEAPGSPDLFSLSFAPGPRSGVAIAAAPVSDAGNAASAETADDGGIDRLFDAIAQIERAIAEEVALNGPQSRVLIDHYRSMSAWYEELGDPFRALAASEQARAVVRMNDGLHTLDQAAIVGQSIEMLEAAGAFSESDELQDELLDLAGRNDGDTRAPSILASVADRQMNAVTAYLEQDVWPRARQSLQAIEGSGWQPSTPATGRQRALTELAVIADRYDVAIEEALADDDYELGTALDTEVEITEIYALVDIANDFVEVGPLPRNDRNGPTWDPEPPRGDRDLAIAALNRARRLYSAAMQAAFRQGSEAEYGGLDEQLVETYYFEAANPELGSDVHVDHMVPSPLESVLRARVADRMTRGAPAVEVASAMLELGDALENREALERYQDAYDFLVARDASADVVAGLFHPEVPAIRRAFGPEDSSIFDPLRSYRGYIDVGVETSRYGQTRDAEIIDASPGTSRAIERRLRKHVSQTRFRPRFAEGEPVGSDQFVLRYYYDYELID